MIKVWSLLKILVTHANFYLYRYCVFLCNSKNLVRLQFDLVDTYAKP